MKLSSKITALLLAIVMTLCLASCGGETSVTPEVTPDSTPDSTMEDNQEENIEMKYDAPTNVGLVYENDTAKISWDKVPGAETYNIYRSGSRYGEYIKLNAEPIVPTEFIDSEKNDSFHYRVTGIKGEKETNPSNEISGEINIWGKNVYVFSPDDDPEKVKELINTTRNRQEANQFGKQRYALLFKPGEYAPDIEVKVGFYMHVAGLGLLPTDTELEKLTCDARWLSSGSNNNATCNFWRAAENFSVRTDTLWAVSQAVSMRRMNIDGNLFLHDNYGWASGGFLADSVVTGTVNSGSQQQWLSRNDNWGRWDGQSWNMVFVGIGDNKAPQGSWPRQRFTVAETTPYVQEKPFVFYEDGSYSVFLPEAREDSSGISWADGAVGEKIPLDAFYVAKPDTDTADTLNAALEAGKNLLFTPGIYKLDKSLKVDNPDTIVMGIGLATLTPTEGNHCMDVADEDGVKICGLLFDAGEKTSDVMLQVGEEDSNASHADNPIILSDLYFRVGGANPNFTSATVSAIINANNVFGDNFWVWRADHGDGVSWTKNPAKNGLIVNGDDVTFYSLMVEHYQEYQLIWNGERGKTYFYQSEIPYDVPNQASWMNGDINGFASYKVGDHVQEHTAMGLGIYSFHRDATVDLNSAMEVPDTENVEVINVCAIMITGNPGISHVVNNSGLAANTAGARSDIMYYCNGEAVLQ